MLTAENFNQFGSGKLPGHLGIIITQVSAAEVVAELAITEALMAPNGYLHAGTVITLADTCAGYGCIVNLPPGATGFTTIELKSNHLGTAREGTIVGSAKPAHLGKTTHVWDAIVSHKESGKTMALFRCTQMILYARAATKDGAA
ncbi:MAG TPA: PaaI family thioesterase [Steroidobacteraceae bacterium]|jgi:1,4-dihydroxy-2-naphthoyl-CoA hydrolase|nr:PaaI family thioesterase [Steroidobacteraceae bacterium]